MVAVLLIAALVCWIAAIAAGIIAWRVDRRPRPYLYGNPAGPWILTAAVLSAAMIGCGVSAAIVHAHRGDMKDAGRLFADAARAEKQFRASHGHYGTLDVDLALTDPKLIDELGRHRRLKIELSEDAKTAKITAEAGRTQISAFIGDKAPVASHG